MGNKRVILWVLLKHMFLSYRLFNFMCLWVYWEGNNRPASRGVLLFLYKLKDNYPVQEIPKIRSVARQVNVLYTFKRCSLHNISLYARYTGWNRRNGPEFGRVFLMLNYTEIPQNTYIQSWTFSEIMAIEYCGLPSGPRTIAVSWHSYLLVICSWNCSRQACYVTTQRSRMLYSTSNRKYKYDTNARNFAVTINGFLSLTSYFDEKYSY